MATKKAQRVGIWVIAAAMIIGTVGGFAAMMLAPKNEAADQARLQEDFKKYQDEQLKAQEESAKANRALDGYTAEAFDPATAKELKVEVLKQGEGEVLKSDSSVTVNYFGWTTDGKIFDSSNKNGTVTPVDLSLSGVIEGWKEGLTGVKAGSTVKLTIPADKAYGSEDTGTGQPVGPLQFIIEVKELNKNG